MTLFLSEMIQQKRYWSKCSENSHFRIGLAMNDLWNLNCSQPYELAYLLIERQIR